MTLSTFKQKASIVFFLVAIVPIDFVFGEARFKRLLDGSNFGNGNIGATRDIVQDNYGFLWIAGENGVIRYDGVSVKKYTHIRNQPSLSTNYVLTMLVDHNGVVWAGTDLGLCQFDPAIDNFRCFNSKNNALEGLSGSAIYALELDKKNNIYVGTAHGLYIFDPDRNKTKRLFSDKTRSQAFSGRIASLLLDRQWLWVGTSEHGLCKVNLNTKELLHYKYAPNSANHVNFPHVKSILKDAAGHIWIGTFGGGISRLNQETNMFSHFLHNPEDPSSIGSNVIWDSHLDSKGNIWFATDHGGIAIYQEDHRNFINYRQSPYDHSSLSSDQVRSIYEDYNGNLWIGVSPIGVNYLSRPSQVFQHYSSRPDNKNSLSHPGILSLLQDKSGAVWVGTENGLNEIHPITRSITRYLPHPGKVGELQSGPVLSLERGNDNDIWIGSWSGGLHRFDLGTRTFFHFQPNSEDPNGIHSHFIWKILLDQDGNLWLATEDYGLIKYKIDEGKAVYFRHDKEDPTTISSDFVLNLLIDSKNNLWVATTEGFDRLNPDDGTFEHFENIFAQSRGSDNSRITTRYRSILEDNIDRIWVGTQNHGIFIYDPHSGKVDNVDTRSGLPSNFVASLILDKSGHVWATTSSGAAKINTNNLSNISVFTNKNGLSGSSFNRDATLVDDQGRVYLGGIEGLNVFHPNDIRHKNTDIPVLIKDFLLFNQSTLPNDSNSPLEESILNTESINLNHSHSMITFEYIGLNYESPETTQYAYQLVGFDESWNYVNNKRFATYTNLKEGAYTFRVKAKVDGGQWSKNSSEIAINITPPPWRTWWATIIYGLIAIGISSLYIRMQSKRVELNSEKSLNIQLRKLNDIKDAFLANTSHELRTPLNGIIGIAESVVEEAQSQLSTSLHHKLQLIVLSGKRLSGLINDILDYTKLGHSTLKIYPRPTNLYELTEEVIELLLPLVDGKHLEIINEINKKTPPVHADENRLQQILLNIIGNSIKFTDSGHIKVSAIVRDGFVRIQVADTGIGIPKDQVENVFGVFQQVDGQKQHSGTGLGLAVSKQLVELHGGEIHIVSDCNKGAIVSFTVPISSEDSQTHPITLSAGQNSTDSVASIDLAKVNKNPIVEPTQIKAQTPISAPPKNSECYTILLVDDDAINRMVLVSMLKLHGYQLIEAVDGPSALEYIEHNKVDLVILDIMMPKMSGYEVCSTIRKKYPLHVLPIMFLTAKKVDEDVAKGYSMGGNEFLTKPVSKYELLPRVGNHIRLLELYRSLNIVSSSDQEEPIA